MSYFDDMISRRTQVGIICLCLVVAVSLDLHS